MVVAFKLGHIIIYNLPNDVNPCISPNTHPWTFKTFALFFSLSLCVSIANKALWQVKELKQTLLASLTYEKNHRNSNWGKYFIFQITPYYTEFICYSHSTTWAFVFIKYPILMILMLLFYSVYLCLTLDPRRDKNKHNSAYFNITTAVFY